MSARRIHRRIPEENRAFKLRSQEAEGVGFFRPPRDTGSGPFKPPSGFFCGQSPGRSLQFFEQVLDRNAPKSLWNSSPHGYPSSYLSSLSKARRSLTSLPAKKMDGPNQTLYRSIAPPKDQEGFSFPEIPPIPLPVIGSNNQGFFMVIAP
jgi:hypothetical protein